MVCLYDIWKNKAYTLQLYFELAIIINDQKLTIF